MIGKLKNAGLALAAVLTISVAAASAASAQNQGFGTSEGPVTLTGVETAGTKNALTAFGASVECPGSAYTGHKAITAVETEAGKKHEYLAKVFTTVTITPHYKQDKHNCKSTSGLPVTIDTNGCDYVIHLKTTTPMGNKEHTYGIQYDIVCPKGKEITVTLFTNVEKETIGKPFCFLHVPPQLGLEGAHAKDTTNGHVDFIGTVKGVKVKMMNFGLEDAFLCPNQETSLGEIDVDITVGGHSASLTSTAIGITE
jgi:hypothetical protein